MTMHKFFRNLIISVVALVCWIAFYYVKHNVYASSCADATLWWQAVCESVWGGGICMWTGGVCTEIGWWGGGFPWWDVIYGQIGTMLSSQWIMNNFNLVTNSNVSNFTGLYFAKMSGSDELGRIIFYTGLDLTDTGTQNFLSGELPNSIGMEQWEIWFNPGSGFEGKNATLIMHVPDFRAPYLDDMDANDFYVREGSGGAFTGNGMITNVTSWWVCTAWLFGCSVLLDVGHFTMFGIKPILTQVHIQSNAGTGVRSWNIIYLSFTGSEALTGVTVTIAGNIANLQWWGTTRYASWILTTGGVIGSRVPFTINFSDYYNNSGNIVTWTTDSSYVNYRLASTDATLSALSISTGTLSPTFSSGTTSYTVTYPYSFTGTVTITGTKNHAYASISSGSYSLSLPTAGSTGSMFITVQSQSGNTSTYTVNIVRAAASTDANLSNLTISTGTLSPTFSSGTTSYTVTYPYSFTGTVTITGTKNHAYASISSGSYSLALSTKWSTGTMFITVTAENNSTKTYTVTIIRMPASTDANLSSLTLSTGTLSPTFASGTTSYTVQMLYSYIGTITSTPLASNAYATLSGTTSLSLSSAGSTGSLSILVIAEDGTTTKTYTIGFTRSTPPAVATTSINGTVNVTWWSAYLSGATSTWATFTSTGTLHIIWDTTNDYIELSVSGVIITAAWGTRDWVLLAPNDLISGDNNNATTTELWLNSSTNTVLLTVQAWSNTDSLIVTGGYFNLSFVVPGWTAGNVLKLYRSENGSTWTANTPDATCTLTTNLVCGFRTDHLSYFTTVKETTSSGWSWGGGSSSTTYNTGDTTTWTISRWSGNIVWSPYPDEWNFAYLYAYDLWITTMKTIQQANMEGNLIRMHMAKMMVNYAIKVLGKYPDTSLSCEFDDIANETTEMKNYIKRACQLGLMGQGITHFDPRWEVTRAQFGTVLSRAMYNNQYEWWTPYYLNHLNGLQSKGIITNIDPNLKEIRAYVMLMMMRAAKK